MYQFKGGLVTTSLLDLLDCIAILLLLCQISCFWYTVVCDCEILMLCPRNLMKGICKTLWGGIIWMIIWFLLIFSPFFGIDASLKYFKLCQTMFLISSGYLWKAFFVVNAIYILVQREFSPLVMPYWWAFLHNIFSVIVKNLCWCLYNLITILNMLWYNLYSGR